MLGIQPRRKTSFSRVSNAMGKYVERSSRILRLNEQCNPQSQLLLFTPRRNSRFVAGTNTPSLIFQQCLCFSGCIDEAEEPEVSDQIKDTNAAAENYWLKSQPYVKCGESDKMLEPESEQNAPVAVSVVENGTKGYETPVKVKFNDHLKTPSNECPQYYTDMTSRRNHSS